MAITAMTDIVINGVGTAYLIGTDGKLSPLGKLEDMAIEISTTTEKVFGGDSIFPFYEFTKDKSCGFTFTNATFNLNMITLSQGSAQTAGELYGSETVTVNTAAAQLTPTSGVDVASVVLVKTSDGSAMTNVGASTPASATEFKVTAAGAITFHATVTNGTTFEASYVYTKAGTVGTDILSTDLPGFVELRHVSNPIKMPDGNTYRLHSRVYKARCDGKLEVSFKRGTASAPKLTFTSLDSSRADKKFASFTLEKVN